MHKVYDLFKTAKTTNEKLFAVLVDPDENKTQQIDNIIASANQGVDVFFVGGSLVVNSQLDEIITHLKDLDKPVVLFPGSTRQISYRADAILFLSLISGRNAELLIGKHVETAPFLKMSPLEVLSTGYMLIDGGVPTAVSYMSNTFPIPYSKDDIAMSTAMAGELLGLKQIFMDAGSGAKNPISPSMIEMVSEGIDIPLIVGGGIKTAENAKDAAVAGADVIVIGDAIEKNPSLISEMSNAIHG